MRRTATAMAAVLAATCITPITAQAQAQEQVQAEENGEDIFVTGYAGSLGRARDMKRDADIVRDVILAEDMAKFPELNLAESLQRLPGVAINREGGEGRRITLRGLGPDFTRVQLNGMEALGNVDSAMDSRGQRSRDRAFDFNIFASELFQRIELEKSYQVAQNEGGMAGTVGLFTAKPFDFAAGSKVALSARLGTNSFTEDAQPRLAAMAGYNFNDRFGILVSASYSKRKTEEQGYNVYSPMVGNPQLMQFLLSRGLDISPLNDEQRARLLSGDVTLPTGNRLSVWQADQERLGLTMAAQWRPADTLTLTLDGLHGRFSTDRSELHLATRPDQGSVAINGAYNDFGRPFAATRINDIRWDDTGYVTYIDTDNTVFGTENRRSVNRNRFNQLVLRGDWQASDAFSLDGHIGYQSSNYRTPIDDKLYMQAQGGLIASYDADGRGAHNQYKWNTTDMANYNIREMYFREFWNETSLKEAVINGRYGFAEGLTLRFGGAYRQYENAGSNAYNDDLYAEEFKSRPGYDAVFPYGTFVTGHKSGQSWVVGDWDRALAYYGKEHTMEGAWEIDTTFQVTEKTWAGYLQLDWNTELAGMRLRGNVGGRVYHTDVINNGMIRNAAWEMTEASVTSDYSGFLPALNAALEVTPNMLVRFAASRNINRPALGSMAQSGNVQEQDGEYFVSNGNPWLQPYKDTSVELSAEWYFGRMGLISVGLFHKDIDNLISSEVLRGIRYEETGLPTNILPGLTPDTIVTEYSRPVNIDKARVSGIELAAQAQFTFLPAPFDKLGMLANATFLDSNAPINGQDGPITGMSDTNANATLFYETALWGLRGSVNYRSDWLRVRFDGANPLTENGFHGTTYVDAAAFVNVTPNIRLTLDAINLTNTREVQFASTYRRLHNETRSGTTVLLGVMANF